MLLLLSAASCFTCIHVLHVHATVALAMLGFENLAQSTNVRFYEYSLWN